MRLPRRSAPSEDPQPDLLALQDDHARAQALAAQQPTEPLGPVDGAWLTAHLGACDGCRSVAAAYETDRQLLRGLRERTPQPPRDLWARTSSALDLESERTVRIRRASLPPRSPRQSPRGWPAASHRRPRISPVVASGLLAIVLIATSALTNGFGPVLFPQASARPSGPGATPIAVAADVGWIQTGSNGSYDVYLTTIDQVCPLADPSACDPIQEVARGSILLGSQPRSVSYSPNSSQLVVVSANAGTGGSVLVVTVPTAAPRLLPSATPAVTASSRPSVSGSPVVSASPAVQTSAPSGARPSPAASGASPVPTLEPGTVVTIAEGVVVVGGTAAHSPDGSWFAFAARPADGSVGPDIYVWRVGDALARAVTSDHRSVFSGWIGDRILGTRIDLPTTPGAGAATTAPGPSTQPALQAPGSPAPSAGTRPSPPATSGDAHSNGPAGTRAGASAGPTGPTFASSPSPAPGATPAPTVTPWDVAGELGVSSFLLDPLTGETRELPALRYLRPVVDPTGRWVVYWDGTVVSDADGLDWRPATGRLVVAPWVAGGAGTSPPPALPPAATGSPAASGATAPATAAPSLPGRIPAGSTPKPAAATARPGSGATPPAAAASGSTVSGSPATRQAPSAGPAGPQLLVDGPLLDFDAQFDPGGTHLVVWIANPADPGQGVLSLFVLLDGAWRLDPDRRLLAAEALRGFAIGDGEVAWVTPPDATGQGSRVEVLGWTADGFGSVESVPGESLLVIR